MSKALFGYPVEFRRCLCKHVFYKDLQILCNLKFSSNLPVYPEIFFRCFSNFILKSLKISVKIAPREAQFFETECNHSRRSVEGCRKIFKLKFGKYHEMREAVLGVSQRIKNVLVFLFIIPGGREKGVRTKLKTASVCQFR